MFVLYYVSGDARTNITIIIVIIIIIMILLFKKKIVLKWSPLFR